MSWCLWSVVRSKRGNVHDFLYTKFCSWYYENMAISINHSQTVWGGHIHKRVNIIPTISVDCMMDSGHVRMVLRDCTQTRRIHKCRFASSAARVWHCVTFNHAETWPLCVLCVLGHRVISPWSNASQQPSLICHSNMWLVAFSIVVLGLMHHASWHGCHPSWPEL